MCLKIFKPNSIDTIQTNGRIKSIDRPILKKNILFRMNRNLKEEKKSNISVSSKKAAISENIRN